MELVILTRRIARLTLDMRKHNTACVDKRCILRVQFPHDCAWYHSNSRNEATPSTCSWNFTFFPCVMNAPSAFEMENCSNILVVKTQCECMYVRPIATTFGACTDGNAAGQALRSENRPWFTKIGITIRFQPPELRLCVLNSAVGCRQPYNNARMKSPVGKAPQSEG